MFVLPDAGSLKAFADVRYGELTIRGVRLLQGTKGRYVSMPQEQGKDNKWYDQVVCNSAEAHLELSRVAWRHYDEMRSDDAVAAMRHEIPPPRSREEAAWQNVL
jgi:stage V sporulation protein G